MSAQGAGGGRRWWIVGSVVLLVAVLATVGVVVLTSRGSSASASVTLESANKAGKDPFSDSVQIGQAAAFPGNVTAIVTTAQHKLPVDDHTHTYVATGTAPGLYGGTGNTHVCDSAKLVTYLQQHPDKARAWAGVFGIAPSDIANYVATLTPVVLTTDTLVTNHGYRNGVANPLQSVLQAGTAVMVDATGTPRVKCNCGNPLTPPEPINVTNATVTGTPWTGYHPGNITTVTRGPKTSTFTLINVHTGDNYTVPAGNSAGGQWVATMESTNSAPGEGQGTLITSRDGIHWSTVGTFPSSDAQGLATDGRIWEMLVGDGSANVEFDVLASTDLRTWNQVATLPGTAGGLAYGNGQWTAVGSAGDQAAATGVVDISTDSTHWRRVATTPNLNQLSAVAYGNGRWVAAGSGYSGGQIGTVVSSDGAHWTPGGTPTGAAVGGIDSSGGRLTMATANTTAPTAGGGIVADNRTDFSTDGQTWISQPATGVAGAGIAALAHGGNQWLATATNPSGSTTVMTSTDAVSWSTATTLPGLVDHLAYGPPPAGRTTPISAGPPITAATTTTTTTTTTLPPAPTPAPAPSSGSAGPCTAAAIAPALAPQHQLDGTPICVGTWAYALVLDKSGPQNSWADVNNLFQWNGHAWVRYQGDASICTPGRLPPAIYFPECQTN